MNSINRASLECKNLHEYLCSLPPVLLESLYEHPATCMAVFRELPELAKYYVMRILFVENPVTKPAAAAWVIKDAKRDHEAAITALCNLHVWSECQHRGNMTSSYTMSSVFRRNLQKAIIGRQWRKAAGIGSLLTPSGSFQANGEAWSTTEHLGPDKHVKDEVALDQYAAERWELLLHYLVGSESNSSDGQVRDLSQDLKDLLLSSGLMRQDEDSDGRQYSIITSKGFQFLLLDTSSQVWFFVLEYLNWVQERGMNLVPILRFLFELSFSSVGKDLPTGGRDDHVLQCLQHFREMGLVLQRKRTSRRFYPTRLAVNLVSGSSKRPETSSKTGFIIAETNYRVYAYTESELQYCILSLFCEMIYRFPNVCVLQLTRESVQTAVVNGITADQILHYLRANAHPDMLKNDLIIAPTLADQIRLWAMERDRLSFREGVLYNQFLTQSDFEVLRNYAQDLGALIWQNSAKRNMVVTREAHDQVKKFWKRYKKDTET